MQSWTCHSCREKQYHDTPYGGRCALCGNECCFSCIQEYSIPLKTLQVPSNNLFLGPEYYTYLKISYPTLPDNRVLYNICIKCITETETLFIKSIPYEKLALLVNHPWYGTGTDRLYKNRLSRTQD